MERSIKGKRHGAILTLAREGCFLHHVLNTYYFSHCSLLTLSRVIVGLGQPNQTHINFRDSKLTRILQPSLSGNARMAVICCATPSEFYLEETRSTLLFASRAKLVKTRAQVNEVLDDRSLIKRLQRELAEARRQSAGPGQLQHLKALETEALNAETAARVAEKKLDKLKSSILNHAAVFGASTSNHERQQGMKADSGVHSAVITKKRRLSDGAIIIDNTALTTPSRASTQQASSPSSVPREHKKLKKIELKGPLSPSSELELVREAYNVKVEQAKELERRLGQMEVKFGDAQASLTQASQTIIELESTKDDAIEESQHLSSEISSLFTEMQAAALRHENAVKAKDATISELAEKLEKEQSKKATLEESMNELTKENVRLNEVIHAGEKRAVVETTKFSEEKSQFQDSIEALLMEKAALVERCKQMESAQLDSNQMILELKKEKEELQGRVDSLSEERVKGAFEVAKANTEREQLSREKESNQKQIQEMSSELTLLKATMGDMVEEKGVLANELSAANDSLREIKEEREGLVEKVTELTNTIKSQDSIIEELQNRIQDMETIASAIVDEISLKELKLAETTSQVQSLTTELEAKVKAMLKLEESVQDSQSRLDLVGRDAAIAEEVIDTLKTTIAELEAEREELKRILHAATDDKIAVESQVAALEASKADVEVQLSTALTQVGVLAAEKQALSNDVAARQASEASKSEELHDARLSLEKSLEEITTLKTLISEMESERKELSRKLDAATDDKAAVESQVAALKTSKCRS